MRIVIDGRFWSESGLGRYIRNLVSELQDIDKINNYFILHLKKDFDKITYQNNNFQKVLADFKWYGVDEQVKLPKLLNELQPDLVHFTHFNVPIFYKGKFIVTIHDLIHQHFLTRNTTTLNPFFHALKKMGYKKVFSAAVNNSTKILVPSEFIKNQLEKEWGVKKEKIEVTHEGVDERIEKIYGETSEKGFEKLAEKFMFKRPFLFYVGNAQPHKNLNRLINVFGKLKENFSDLSLVLSGPENSFWEKTKKESYTKGVIFTGWLSEEELVLLYKNAESFVMPSLEEGFGIPVLEAMVCGCPVVSSNQGSLPEVAGNAALYFNPKNENEWIEKITKILTDKKLRKYLINNGKKRYKEFSWKELAKKTLKVYTLKQENDQK